MAYRTIGNALVEWDENAAFIFTINEESGPEDSRAVHTERIDLTPLRAGFEDEFLLNLKEYIIELRHRVSLTTIHAYAKRLKLLFNTIIKLGVFSEKVSLIDESFLLRLGSVHEKIPTSYKIALVSTFSTTPTSPIFAKGLQASDLAFLKEDRFWLKKRIKAITSKALTQAAIAHILDLCDLAYASGELSISHYSFAHLAFAVFCRPNSYRQIQVGHLNFDPEKKLHTITIPASKTRSHTPIQTTFGINEPLAILLHKQRQHVVSTFGHLVAPGDIEKLALFPSRGLTLDKSKWLSPYANRSWGMHESGTSFHLSYPREVARLIDAKVTTLNATAMRHTVGTLLAQSGASAKVIQAVLRHATESTCRSYVDMAFHGLIGELTDAMRPAFESHLPTLLNFRSKSELTTEERCIRTEDLATGQVEDVGECGKSIACESAPIVCYSCFRFRPCWDADHYINVNILDREIADMEKRGKPFEHMVERARRAKNRIILVMNAAQLYRTSMEQEGQA